MIECAIECAMGVQWMGTRQGEVELAKSCLGGTNVGKEELVIVFE